VIREPVVMEPSTQSRSQTGHMSTVVRAEWSAGPRTPTWDRLWRTMLRGLEIEPVPEAADQLGREGDDG
jgi:hypothetical protein